MKSETDFLNILFSAGRHISIRLFTVDFSHEELSCQYNAANVKRIYEFAVSSDPNKVCYTFHVFFIQSIFLLYCHIPFIDTFTARVQQKKNITA